MTSSPSNRFAGLNWEKSHRGLYRRCENCKEEYLIDYMTKVKLYLHNGVTGAGYVCPHCRKKLEAEGLEFDILEVPKVVF